MPEQEIPLTINHSEQKNDPHLDIKMKKAIEKPKASASSAEVLDFLLTKNSEDLIPYEDCILPSRGLYYNGLIPEGKVKVKPMNINTEKIMSTGRLVQSGQSLDFVFKHHIQFPNAFDPANLLVGDWTYLFFVLRGVSYGNIYEFSFTCPNEDCGKVSFQKYDLNNINQTINWAKHTSEPMKISLPYFSEITGRDVCVEARYLRWGDLKEIRKRSHAMEVLEGKAVRNAKTGDRMSGESRIESFDDSIEHNLNLAIISVNGVRDPMKISEFVKRLHAKDIAVIRNFLDDAPGIDTDIIITCPQCNQEVKTTLPFTVEFFRPKGPRDM